MERRLGSAARPRGNQGKCASGAWDPAEVGGWNVDAGLIVLSGCASGAALARPGAGLMGMTRAWLMAGARAVVATGWSTPDDVGVFFGRFYRRLQRSSSSDPAEALQGAQIET